MKANVPSFDTPIKYRPQLLQDKSNTWWKHIWISAVNKFMNIQ